MKSNPNPLFATILKSQPSKGDLQKIRILEQTLLLLAKEGVENVSLETVGKSLGMIRAHIAYYFKSKEELLLAVIRYVVVTAQEITVRRMEKARTPTEILEAIVHGAFDWLEEAPHSLPAVALLYYYTSVSKEVRQFHTQVRRLGRDRIVFALNSIRPKLKPAEREVLALKIHAAISGSILEWGTVESGTSLSRLRRDTLDWVLQLAHGQHQ